MSLLEKSLNDLEEENEKVGLQVSIAQKQAIIREAKHKYGKNWMSVLGEKKIVSGLDWNALKFKM